jgi:hypothetical protein
MGLILCRLTGMVLEMVVERLMRSNCIWLNREIDIERGLAHIGAKHKNGVICDFWHFVGLVVVLRHECV